MASYDAIAEHLDLKKARVGALVKAGVLNRGQSLDEARVAYIRHLRETAAGRAGGDGDEVVLTRERALLARSQRIKTDLQAAVLRGDLIPASVALLAMKNQIMAARQRLLPLHRKIRARVPGLPDAALEAIETEVREVLTDLSRQEVPSELRTAVQRHLQTLAEQQ